MQLGCWHGGASLTTSLLLLLSVNSKQMHLLLNNSWLSNKLINSGASILYTHIAMRINNICKEKYFFPLEKSKVGRSYTSVFIRKATFMTEIQSSAIHDRDTYSPVIFMTEILTVQWYSWERYLQSRDILDRDTYTPVLFPNCWNV